MSVMKVGEVVGEVYSFRMAKEVGRTTVVPCFEAAQTVPVLARPRKARVRPAVRMSVGRKEEIQKKNAEYVLKLGM